MPRAPPLPPAALLAVPRRLRAGAVAAPARGALARAHAALPGRTCKAAHRRTCRHPARCARAAGLP
eukprot:365619-Chlamydomonas_euryale.AAC.14